jgi:subtilase family serine protease
VSIGGYGPADLHSAYALPSSGGVDKIVAIVDAFDQPRAETDLAAYRSHYGLPACTSANGCFRKVDQNGGTNYPAYNAGWGIEIALDLDMVSAICPDCHILLVEATNNQLTNLGTGVNTAVSLGAIAVSNSYAGPEWSIASYYDTLYFNHPGVAIVAGSGDCGYNCEGSLPDNAEAGVGYPAASPYVVAVGGTKLLPAANARGWTETAWDGAGSGCSLY